MRAISFVLNTYTEAKKSTTLVFESCACVVHQVDLSITSCDADVCLRERLLFFFFSFSRLQSASAFDQIMLFMTASHYTSVFCIYFRFYV